MESLVTVIGEVDLDAVPGFPKSDPQSAVKLVMGLLPDDPGVNEIVNCALPGIAVTLMGAPGGVGLVTTTVPVVPRKLVGELVAAVKLFAPERVSESVPSVGMD